MALIIDAYNVLHCTHVLPNRYAMISATDLCRLLEQSRWAGRAMAVVCDGVQKPSEADYEGEVELIYAGSGGDADSVIEKMIVESDAPRDLTVVSNDRRIQKAARRRRARSMTSERFLQLLVKSTANRKPPTDAKPRAIGSTDDWLDTFEIDAHTVDHIEQQVEQETNPAPSPPTTQSTTPKPDSNPKPPVEHKPDTDTDYWLRQFGFEQGDKENDLKD
jgi:predicted RNA-binding protein with PIN domain